MEAVEAGKKLEILKKKTRLDLTLNELRIIVGCFRAVAYQAERDDEQYLDKDAVDLKARLESLYAKLLKDNGNNGSAR